MLESSQEALNIILQDSGYGRLYSPVEKFFQYLERLDEWISVAMRHRQAGKAQGRSKDSHHRDSHHKDNKQKNDPYSGGRSLRSDVSQDGCGVFCSDGKKLVPQGEGRKCDSRVIEEKGFLLLLHQQKVHKWKH